MTDRIIFNVSTLETQTVALSPEEEASRNELYKREMTNESVLKAPSKGFGGPSGAEIFHGNR